ncbi:CHAT domain-containing protein [Geodermatophilus sp. URMC 61]|uniref:CHAT domain-containing protein n=1 Tax=Geodermatophilus sp. URMC 61 TaxID=3423411 RepID=UPI00406D2DD7
MTGTTVGDLLPTPPVSSAAPAVDLQQASAPLPVAPPLLIDVVWGHLARTPGDIHVTGHYLGVMPTAAERALDEAISVPGGRQLIAEHTRRRWLVGALGEVSYFPGHTPGGAGDSLVVRAAVAGMGRVGTFSESNAVRLYASLVRELAGLACVEHAVTVPIGAGAGNLTIDQVARALVVGCGEGLAGLSPEDRRLRQVSVVEMNRLRAEKLHAALTEAARIEAARAEAAHGRARVRVLPEMATAPGGEVGPDAVVLYLARSLLTRLTRHHGDEATGRLLDDVRADLPGEIRDQMAAKLAELASEPAEVVDVRLRAAEDIDPPAKGSPSEDAVPTRITALQPTDAGGVSLSALTARATVPEREVRLDRNLLAELIRRLTAPEERDAEELPPFLTRLLVPLDLRAYLNGDAPLIVEVDPRTARVPWEFLMPATEAGENLEPLAVRQPLARQMRTTYARTDIDAPAPQEMRALVIGDPGDGDLSLNGAREEAVAVADVLKRHGIRVEAYIGSADSPPTAESRPATRLDVLAKVLTGRYDLIHYAGHGVFDPVKPELSGWLFADGLLTARELTQMSRAPWLVMANACWSAARPDTGRLDAGAPQPARGREGELAPVLADEFLRVGVGHFIGASWRVPDGNAREFAVRFYERLLGEGEAARENVGRALLEARREQWTSSRTRPQATPEQRNAWAAYQHYGDPGDGLRTRVLSSTDVPRG